MDEFIAGIRWKGNLQILGFKYASDCWLETNESYEASEGGKIKNDIVKAFPFTLSMTTCL